MCFLVQFTLVCLCCSLRHGLAIHFLLYGLITFFNTSMYSFSGHMYMKFIFYLSYRHIFCLDIDLHILLSIRTVVIRDRPHLVFWLKLPFLKNTCLTLIDLKIFQFQKQFHLVISCKKLLKSRLL